MSKIIYNDRAYGEIIGGGGAGGLGGGIELTQAEYDALDQSEKDKDIIYFITDGNPEGMVVNDSVPIGSIQAYAGANPPGNWLICAGQAVSRTKYQKLFSVIGTTYGEGDGETTFNLPNLQGRVAIGRSEDYELGANGGEEAHLLTAAQSGTQEHLHTYSKSATTTGSHTLTTSEIPSHQHKITLVNQGSLDYGINFTYGTTAKGGMFGGGYSESVGGGSGHTHGITLTSTNTGTSSSDASEAHNNMQPYLVINYIIKALDSSIIETEKPNFLDLFYPVGSYYETQDSTFNPNTAWGGTWQQLEDTFTAIGGMERFDVSGSGNLTIKAAWGDFPTLTIDGIYKMEIEGYSSTASYTITATLNGTTIGTASTTNCSIHSFINNINGVSGQAFALSILTVNANSHVKITIYLKDNIKRWLRTA